MLHRKINLLLYQSAQKISFVCWSIVVMLYIDMWLCHSGTSLRFGAGYK